jgi:hypothetical protein
MWPQFSWCVSVPREKKREEQGQIDTQKPLALSVFGPRSLQEAFGIAEQTPQVPMLFSVCSTLTSQATVVPPTSQLVEGREQEAGGSSVAIQAIWGSWHEVLASWELLPSLVVFCSALG